MQQQRSDLSFPELIQNKEVKNNKKKKYLTRMKIITENTETITSTYRYPYHQTQENYRQRNNKASQESRARKKIYLTTLEHTVQQLQTDIQQTNHEIERYHHEIFNALMHTEEIGKESAEMQSLVLKKLKQLSQTEGSVGRDAQINICLESCLYRIGASGSERRAILNILYKGMINRNIPNIYRYIAWSAANQCHLFGKKEERNFESWGRQIQKIVEEVIEKNNDLLQQQGQRVAVKAKQIYRSCSEMLKKKQEIEQYGLKIDQTVREFRKVLSPVQFAELFLFVERSVHKAELDLLIEEKEQWQQGISSKKLKRE